MDFSALGGYHERNHSIPWRSSMSSEHTFKLRFSRFFSVIPAGARLFFLGVLALLLTLPCTYRVEAVTFAFNGFEEGDVFMVPGSPWTFQPNTSCFFFDPPQASWNKSVASRFLNPDLVKMKDPVTKQVKSFSTTFIYQIRANSSTFGPGMSFIVVPDNITVGAAEDYMGLLTADTPSSAKNYQSDNHTLGVELDTFMNIEFNDPNENHIGVNLASMNSAFIFIPGYQLSSTVEYLYTQIWIDYSEADSRMDISIAAYGKGKPTTPQGSMTGIDLSLLLENMYIGFSTAKGMESDNVPYVCAWSFSSDGIPTPPIVMADGPSIAPTPTSKKKKSLNWKAIVGITVVFAFVVGICLLCLLRRRIIFQHPLRIFISHGAASNAQEKMFTMALYNRMTSLLKSRAKIFFDRKDIDSDEIFTQRIFEELARFDVGIVVITEEYFKRKWCMNELIAFVEAQRNDLKNRIHILPLFYGLTLDDLKVHLDEGTWEDSWKEMVKGYHPIEVEKYREAVNWLCHQKGIQYALYRQDYDIEYINKVCEEVDKILICKKRSFASNLCWAKTTMVEKVTAMTYIGTEKRMKRANQRFEKENGLMTYINKRLQLLFALSGLLNILLSVILDNFFNDLPIRFIAFAILAPLTIFLGILASGWFLHIPLRFIAFLKRHGFLQQVAPCSPWHNNVVIDFCGGVCSLEPRVAEEGIRLLDFPMSIQNFLYGDRIGPQGTTSTIHSTFDSEIKEFQMGTLVQEGQNLQRQTTLCETFDFAPLTRIPKKFHSKMEKSQASLPNSQDAPSQSWNMVDDIDRFFVFHIFDDERAPILEFDGPEINGFHLTIQAFKNTLTKDHSFDLSCTYRDKKTKRMYLNAKRLQNLVENMCQWVENPYPIVVDESSNILHCIAIEDILWEFTKTVYTFKRVHVEHRLLAGLGHIKFFITLSYGSISFVLSLIPLFSDKKSLFFLFFLLVLVPYLIALDDTNPLNFYFIKSLFCPMCIKIFGFNRLYKSRSSFRWCNEFRKKRIVNPSYFWIDEEYANTCPQATSCLNVCEFVELPDSPPKDQSFIIICKGWPTADPTICKKQHDYKLQVKFDSVKLIEDVNFYTNVRLQFFENDSLLSKRTYSAIEVQRVHLVEKLFHCFSNPSFGGYVEKICSTGYCFTTFVAHCPRFVDFCHTIFCSNTIPKLLVASRMFGSKFIIGIPFWSSEL